MAICGNQVYEWEGDETPRRIAVAARQVGVGRTVRYALTDKGAMMAWDDDPERARQIMQGAKSFHAGRSGLFIIRDDDSLWHVETERLFGFGEGVGGRPTRVASDVITASVGDSANYYVTRRGALFVKGRAHRGQYGDGKLASTDTFVRTATDVAQVSSHTGHALILKKNGEVWGTGGNIYGPLGNHGYGDKAAEWGMILDGVTRIATGSSHSVAIRRDKSLWIWGRDEGLEPKRILTNVDAVAASSTSTIALSEGVLWQWSTGQRPARIMKCEQGGDVRVPRDDDEVGYLPQIGDDVFGHTGDGFVGGALNTDSASIGQLLAALRHDTSDPLRVLSAITTSPMWIPLRTKTITGNRLRLM